MVRDWPQDEDDYEDEADEQVIHPYSEAQGLNRAYQRFWSSGNFTSEIFLAPFQN
jgi:hypothetical protein